jgi:hypothetical protein
MCIRDRCVGEDAFPKIFCVLCTEDGDTGAYITNMDNMEVSYLMQECLLTAHGVQDAEEE